MRIITAFLIASAVFIWAFGWYGVAAVALFLLGAFGYAASGSKSGPVARFIERIGKDEKKTDKNGKKMKFSAFFCVFPTFWTIHDLKKS